MPASEGQESHLNEKFAGIMEENQSGDGSSEAVAAALYEDTFDEDETRLVIDEGCLLSEDTDVKFSKKQKQSRTIKLRSKKNLEDVSKLYPCLECGKQFRRKVKLQAHLSTHKAKEKLECLNCGRNDFPTVDLLLEHVCSGTGKMYKCDKCDKSFRLKRDLSLHQPVHLKDLSDKLLESPSDKLKKDPSLQQASPLKDISDEPPDEKDPCEEKDFSSFIESFVKWPISCTQCGVELANLETYNVHMVSHKEGKPCVCLVCKMNFLCQDDYVLHKAVCRIEGVFECTQCCQRFHTEKKLCEHIESHNKGDRVKCEICGMTVEGKDELSAHIKRHKTNIFVCGKCKKIFNCNSSFKDHACISENKEKMSYTFAESSKKTNKQCQDSLSDIDSDADETEFWKDLNGSYSCKACKEVFEDKQDFKTHLKGHYQCIQCRKYFKTQIDLDMHTFLLADEKLYSCYLCGCYVHGKKELDIHLSEHSDLEHLLYDELNCEESNELLQSLPPGMIARKPLQSLSFERPSITAKINKVVLSGNDALKCSGCGKPVPMHHSLANIKPNTPLGDPGEEYFYISRLGIPREKQPNVTYCACQQNSSILSILNELSLSKSLNEYHEDAPKLIHPSKLPAYVESSKPKSSNDKSSKVKPKLSPGGVAEKVSVVQPDTVSNDESSKSDKSNNNDNNLKILKPGTETGHEAPPSNTALVTNNNTANASTSSAASDQATKNDCNNISSDGAKPETSNVDANTFLANLPTKNSGGVKVLKYINKADLAPPRVVDTKQVIGSAAVQDGRLLLPKPVKITFATGMLSPVNALGPLILLGKPENIGGISTNKAVTGIKRSLGGLRVLNQEELMLPAAKRIDLGTGLQENNTVIASNKPKEGKPVAPLLPIQVATRLIAPAPPKGNAPKTLSKKSVNAESKSLGVNGKKRSKNSPPAPLQSPVVTVPTVVTSGNLSKNTKSLGNPKEPLVLIQQKTVKSPKKAQPSRKERVNTRTMPDSSTPKDNESESSLVPDRNMVFKVEKLTYDSEEEEEDEEEDEEGEEEEREAAASLDFSGIKKEFLASDVFIKEEEWDIVDF